MAHIRAYSLGGINTYTNPILNTENNPIQAINVTADSLGVLTRRPGYSTFLGTPDTEQVNSLFSWTKNSGGSAEVYLYRASGSSLYSSYQGTGAWTLCAGGTITDGARVGYGELGTELIIGDGSGSTRHTANGTSFTNTTLAPVSASFEEYQNRVYCVGGTTDHVGYMFASTDGTASNWSTTAPADSFSLDLPGKGTASLVFKTGDRIYGCTSQGNIYRWDGYTRTDMSTELGPSSIDSFAKVEDYCFWLNRNGIYGFDGANVQLLSNPIQKQIYNDDLTGMTGTNFNTAPAVVHHYDYLCAIGTVTDSLTKDQIENAIVKYDFQKNAWHNYRFNHNPTAWHSFTDKDGVRQLIFGNSSGQCYKVGKLGDDDSGSPIEIVVDFLLFGDDPARPKNWKEINLFFNPGCMAQIMYATTDTFDQSLKNWEVIGNALSGHVHYRFGTGYRSHLLYLRITDNASASKFKFYGYDIEYENVR